jgi:hypothetical protein
MELEILSGLFLVRLNERPALKSISGFEDFVAVAL